MSNSTSIRFSAYAPEAAMERFLQEELGARRDRTVLRWRGVESASYLDKRKYLVLPWNGLGAFPPRMVLSCDLDLTTSGPAYWQSIVQAAILGWKRFGGDVEVVAYDETQLTIVNGVLTIPTVRGLSFLDAPDRREFVERLWSAVQGGGDRHV